MLTAAIWLAFVFFTATTANVVGLQPIGKLFSVKYIRTIDGDTIIVERFAKRHIHVRLLGINTAELKSGKSIAFQASQYTAVTLETAAKVFLEIDPVTPKDKYDRTLAWVWVQHNGSRKLLNLELLKHNLAEIYWKNESRRYRKEIMKYKNNKLH